MKGPFGSPHARRHRSALDPQGPVRDCARRVLGEVGWDEAQEDAPTSVPPATGPCSERFSVFMGCSLTEGYYLFESAVLP